MPWWQHPIVHGAITGAVSAAAIDLAAFRKWSSWHDATTYQWGLASWRWFQGALYGGLTAAGLSAFSL